MILIASIILKFVNVSFEVIIKLLVNYSNIILKIDRYPDNIFAFINSSNFKCPDI